MPTCQKIRCLFCGSTKFTQIRVDEGEKIFECTCHKVYVEGDLPVCGGEIIKDVCQLCVFISRTGNVMKAVVEAGIL